MVSCYLDTMKCEIICLLYHIYLAIVKRFILFCQVSVLSFAVHKILNSLISFLFAVCWPFLESNWSSVLKILTYVYILKHLPLSFLFFLLNLLIIVTLKFLSDNSWILLYLILIEIIALFPQNDLACVIISC